MIDSYQANKDLSYALWHYKTRNQTVIFADLKQSKRSKIQFSLISDRVNKKNILDLNK